MMSKLANFLRNNAPLLTCGTIFVAVHYIWYHMQFDEDFVKKEHQKDKIVLGGGLIQVPGPHKKETQQSKEE